MRNAFDDLMKIYDAIYLLIALKSCFLDNEIKFVHRKLGNAFIMREAFSRIDYFTNK